MKRLVRRVLQFLVLGMVFISLLLMLSGERPDPDNESYVYGRLIQNRRFDFMGWELDALGSKALYSLAPPHSYLAPETQQEIVLAFFSQLAQVQSLEGSIAVTFADPAVTDPETAAADLRAQLAEARGRLADLQPLAEGIIEEQIASVLADEGLTMTGRTFPPVKLHFTPLPAMLVISPRDHIEAIRFFALEHGLDTQARVELEEAVDHALNVSSLVTNIGGLAAYPAMMLESTAFNWVIQTAAHEWAHHYLTLRPVGVLYDTDPQLRTINETAASIVGREIGQEVVRRYYPELAPPPTPEPRPGATPTPEPPAFDFRAEMRVTRLQVDELLAHGRIVEAETYMEARRQIFWENGYRIRKINQAYFAFYGAYADEPTGEQGQDPVGPAVVALREQSDSLQEFLHALAPLTRFAELEALIR